ncbi:hypothetical protein C7453_11132 [Gluconacetobacter liquefaciens]|uniref:Uncharacterized protein n=1 Tax=Gluconacetobacter liquefaciens TaxID=89584 RepID=A0A370FXR9_GLULI|nr:hypothetical protein [Gluconacetobacter liquefaciens]RDI36248.1 hypothetical protein C7453_11132 [Gluconacetobacter liquefaciens]
MAPSQGGGWHLAESVGEVAGEALADQGLAEGAAVAGAGHAQGVVGLVQHFARQGAVGDGGRRVGVGGVDRERYQPGVPGAAADADFGDGARAGGLDQDIERRQWVLHREQGVGPCDGGLDAGLLRVEVAGGAQPVEVPVVHVVRPRAL